MFGHFHRNYLSDVAESCACSEVCYLDSQNTNSQRFHSNQKQDSLTTCQPRVTLQKSGNKVSTCHLIVGVKIVFNIILMAVIVDNGPDISYGELILFNS